MPEWWLVASGMFFVLGSAALLLTVFLLAVTIRAVLELRDSVNKLTGKVDEITDKVNSIASTCQSVSTDMGARAGGIARWVDDSAGGAMKVVDKLAPLLLGVGVVFRLMGMVRGKRAKRAPG